MADRHFEIIVSGRQLAVLVGSVVVLLIVAFALGVTAGLRTSPVAAKEVAGPVEMVSPPTWPPASEQVAALATPLPRATPLSTAPLREEADISAEPVPSPVPPATPSPTPLATPAPTRPPAPTAVPTRPPARPTAVPGVWLQVAALSQRELAEGVRQRLLAAGYTREQVVIQAVGPLFRVRLGPFPDEVSAGRVAGRLEEMGFERPFLVRE